MIPSATEPPEPFDPLGPTAPACLVLILAIGLGLAELDVALGDGLAVAWW
jgi:hypothetical protein